MARVTQVKLATHGGRLTSVTDDPPRKNVLLLTCMDQRMLDDTVRFMNSLNLQNRYDQVALAGGAMGALRLPAGAPSKWQELLLAHLEAAIEKLHRPIKDVFLVDHLDCGAYKELHPDEGVREDYKDACREEMLRMHKLELVELKRGVEEFIECKHRAAVKAYDEAHRQCLASCRRSESDEEKRAWQLVEARAGEKVEEWEGIRVSCFVMDLLGDVIQLDVPRTGTPTRRRKA